MLFNEPKLLKPTVADGGLVLLPCFSALQRAEIAEISAGGVMLYPHRGFSALQRAEIAETDQRRRQRQRCDVSVLFNEPKLLKFPRPVAPVTARRSFSALQRAEIAETTALLGTSTAFCGFSALQRAEIAESRARG